MENKRDQVPNIFTAIDLEMNQPSGKIIQIGAVVGDCKTGEILDTLSLFINPNEKLSEFIIKLTGINQEQVDNGLKLEEAYNKLKELHEKYDSFINPITWGGGDSNEIREQLKNELEVENKEIPTWCFGRRWIDVKTLFIGHRISINEKFFGGLAKSMTKVGLTFKGRKHDALCDAENTFRMFYRLLELQKIK